jgi:hypothetical protein
VTAIRVVVARMMPRRVRKLRSLFLWSELKAMRVDSQKEALGRNFRVLATGSVHKTLEGAVLFRDRAKTMQPKMEKGRTRRFSL